jgi:group II intron reverse transcriptase/maturase
MNEHGKSDRSVLPAKQPNKDDAAAPSAEDVEGRDLTKGNAPQQNTLRTQRRESVQSVLEAIRKAAKANKKMRFTALLHHVYNIENLREAFHGINRDASPGIDGETWESYEEELEVNLRHLSDRLKQGAYKAKPVKRVFIAKPDGSQRPLGVPALEDKVVQKAMVSVLNAIYETDFLGFSYGFRPGRNPHNALDALYVGLQTKKVSWVLDADIRGFFDAIDHEWLIKFIEHRIGDKRIVHLIQKWLKAGVLEEGKITRSELGTVQGGSISPLLANIYLHYVFDLWTHQWRQQGTRGEVLVVRYCDDFIVTFQYKSDAERYLKELKERFQKFKLELHPEKTRLIEFGRFAIDNCKKRGEGKPKTFNFLGFTHMCGVKKSGTFVVLRQTEKKRLRAKVTAIKLELQRRKHTPLLHQCRWLKSVVTGHFNYYGVPTNLRALNTFRFRVIGFWMKALRDRSQNDHFTWERMYEMSGRWIPWGHITHPYPLVRFGVKT